MFPVLIKQHNWRSIIDVFAGYVRALLAASEGQGTRFALHRDISATNLLVTKNCAPRVADWGFGCIDNDVARRTASTVERIGTAVYMGVRVLYGCDERSVVDDLESLFLVFGHCLWKEFGTKNPLYEGLWLGKSKTDVAILDREKWLVDKESLVDEMELSPRCPNALQHLLEAMYDALFSGTARIRLYRKSLKEMRVAARDVGEWQRIFTSSAELLDSYNANNMPCLYELRAYAARSLANNEAAVDEITRDFSRLNSQAGQTPPSPVPGQGRNSVRRSASFGGHNVEATPPANLRRKRDVTSSAA
ncbi:hypothetical protein H4S01_004494, partial [Coemansia sp. RSA 2610]